MVSTAFFEYASTMPPKSQRKTEQQLMNAQAPRWMRWNPQTRAYEPKDAAAELVDHRANTWQEWQAVAKLMALSKGEGSPGHLYALARAYIADYVGFYRFCYDIMGYHDMYEPLHKDFVCRHVVEPKTPGGLDARGSMLQVNRGSFKSSIATEAFALWLMAREMTMFYTCDIRILLASEILDLANAFALSIKTTLEENASFHELWGRHKRDFTKGRIWRDTKFVSHFRSRVMKERTISTLATGATRTGTHYDVIIADDLQAERTSSTLDQINICDSGYRLLWSLIEPKFMPDNKMIQLIPGGKPRFSVVCTPWHFDDVYARIEKRNAHHADEDRLAILKIPIILEDGTIPFATRYTHAEIEKLRIDHGPEIFASQYMLNPRPDESRDFDKDDVGRTPDDVIKDPHKFGTMYMSCDPAKTPSRRSLRNRVTDGGGGKSVSYTTIFAAVVDEAGRIYVVEAYRKQVKITTWIDQLFKMDERWQPRALGFSTNDQANYQASIEKEEKAQRHFLKIEWISYPADQNKHERIRVNLDVPLSRRKVFLPDGCDWLLAEIDDFPNSLTFDGLDGLATLVRVSRAPTKRGDRPEAPPRPQRSPRARKTAHLSPRHRKKPNFWDERL